MPWSCFSYPADAPPGIGNRHATRPAPPGLRQMPGTCFSYSVPAPLGIGNRDTVQPGSRGHPTTPGGQPGFVSIACVSYPVVPCFRY